MNDLNKIYRIFDVNLNRSKEGLRVIEEYIRFYLDDEQENLDKIRKIRHGLSKISDKIYIEILKERDIEKDLGCKFKEEKRLNFKSIIIANFKRVEESLRVLEEFSKLLIIENNLDIESKIFKDYRFEIYNLEKDICLNI
jgi:hypothetical protein